MTKFDPTKPTQTRDGRSVRIVCTDVKGPHPIVALIINGEEEAAKSYSLDGRHYCASIENHLDLVNISEKRFVNIWEENKDYEVTQQPYATAEKAREAIASSGYKYIAIAVEVEV